MAGPSRSSRHAPPEDASQPESSAVASRRDDPRHRMSASTLADSMTGPSNQYQIPPSAAAVARVSSNPSSLRSLGKRPRRTAQGGFLLGTGSRKSSLERSSLDQERDSAIYPQPSFHSGASTKVAGRDDVSSDGFADSRENMADVDPARMVSLILNESGKRKEAQTTNRRSHVVADEKAAQAGSSRLKPKEAAGRGRTVSPTRSFLMPNRSPSSTSPSRRRISSLPVTSSPPPAPSRANFPSPYLSAMPSSPSHAQEKKRRSLGYQELKELQSDHNFTEATLQRTLKAKQMLSLYDLYRKLIDIRPHSSAAGTLHSAMAGKAPQQGYNPLQIIRNRRMRNRKNIKLDLAPWEDTRAVEQWIEDFAVSVYSPSPDGGLPPPPQPQSPGTKTKRPKMDWTITPQEMLADYYWVESENIKERALDRERELTRAKRQRQSIEQYDRHRDTAGPIQTHVENESSADETSRHSWDSPRRKYMAASAVENHRFQRNPRHKHDFGFLSSSSDTTDSSDTDDSLDYGSSDDDVAAADKDKHHRRRRKIKRAITGGRHGKKKKKAREQELEERRRTHELGEMEWLASEKSAAPSERLRRGVSSSADEQYDSGPGKLQKTTTGMSYPTHASGSRSSLERFTTNTGYGLPGDKFQDHILPSIAINLSPPREAEKTPNDEKEEDRGTMSPTKKLLEKGKEQFQVKSKEVGLEESGAESIDLERPKITKDKHKDRGMKRVKTKLRHEVAKVEDRIWGRDTGSAMASPSASSFSDSSARTEDEVVFNSYGRDTWASEDDVPKGRASLEVPKATRPNRHRSHHSTSYIPSFPAGLPRRQSLGPERDLRAGRRPALEAPMVSIARDPSPIRGVIIESVNRKNERDTSTKLSDTRPGEPGTISPTILQRTQVPSAQRIITRRPTAAQADIKTLPIDTTRKEIARAKAQFLAAGIVARGCVGTYNGPSKLALAKKQSRSIEASIAGIDDATEEFKVQTSKFTTKTVPKLRGQVDKVRTRLSTVVGPKIREVADNADDLSSKVTTDWTMRAKTVGDEVGAMIRRRRKGLRWIRKSGYVLLEWTLVWVMWLVWLVVMVLKVFRGVFKGVIAGVRWILWI